MTTPRKPAVSATCICEWPPDCGGTGLVECEGCGGGDVCMCRCGGEQPCPGCSECESNDDATIIEDYDGDEPEILV